MPEQFCRWKKLPKHLVKYFDSEWREVGCRGFAEKPFGKQHRSFSHCPYCGKPIQQEDGADE